MVQFQYVLAELFMCKARTDMLLLQACLYFCVQQSKNIRCKLNLVQPKHLGNHQKCDMDMLWLHQITFVFFPPFLFVAYYQHTDKKKIFS